MGVEFVVGSLPCCERFFSGYSSKTKISKLQFDLERTDTKNEFLRTPECFVDKQIPDCTF